MNPVRRRRLGGGAWSPLNLPGLQFWLRPDLIGAANGASLATFPDGGPFHNDGVQATGANQPTFATAGINGKPAVVFTSAGSQYFSLTTGLALPNWTAIAVFKRANTVLNMFILGGSLNHASGEVFNGDQGFYFVSSLATAAGNIYTGDTNPTVGVWQNGAAGSYLTRKNGLQLTAAAVSGNLDVTRIGRRDQPDYSDATIGDVILTNTMLSSGDIIRAERYLSAKYGNIF